ncbi:inner membrane protein YrbG [Limimaricola cinnabarinus LL-001]|uniref:Inner membrane protein YrbG n=1 Tax=Limimaricola cinnabarinus LL-001 TaxID=1337093 RepID=U2YMM3_9RHOB|nr:inner membrane protein YrbG [Limimaricola cinnabarinus LL-001]
MRGAVQAAERIGISPLVIGLTLVGFGTSMPELVTSVQAGLGGFPGIAFGNVVGSNIANILLIAGVSALICPIVVARSALRRDAVVMLAVGVAFAVLAALMPMGRVLGAGLVTLLVGYIWFVIRQERRANEGGAIHDKSAALAGADPGLAPPHTRNGLAMPLLIALAGLALVVVGGSFLVSGAVAIARGFGVSETIIGLTIVAVGTSMPELVTSVIAALKRQGDVPSATSSARTSTTSSGSAAPPLSSRRPTCRRRSCASTRRSWSRCRCCSWSLRRPVFGSGGARGRFWWRATWPMAGCSGPDPWRR